MENLNQILQEIELLLFQKATFRGYVSPAQVVEGYTIEAINTRIDELYQLKAEYE